MGEFEKKHSLYPSNVNLPVEDVRKFIELFNKTGEQEIPFGYPAEKRGGSYNTYSVRKIGDTLEIEYKTGGTEFSRAWFCNEDLRVAINPDDLSQAHYYKYKDNGVWGGPVTEDKNENANNLFNKVLRVFQSSLEDLSDTSF